MKSRARREAFVALLMAISIGAFLIDRDTGIVVTVMCGLVFRQAVRGRPRVVYRMRFKRQLWHWQKHGRPPTSPYLRMTVLRRDRFKCVACDSTYRLEIDHVKPWHYGGKTRLSNLATLCHECNRTKSDYWPGRRYHPWPGYNHKMRARMILASEQHHMRHLERAA